MLGSYLKIGLWTAFIGVCSGLLTVQLHREDTAATIQRAEDFTSKDILFRKWISDQGGIYVPRTELTPPNPYLIEPRTMTCSGKEFTLVNPAYFNRLIYEQDTREGSRIQAKLVSTNPLRPANLADSWEAQALAHPSGSAAIMHTNTTLRYLRFFKTEQSCTKCHPGDLVGSIRGGISLEVPILKRSRLVYYTTMFVFWLIGLIGLVVYIKQRFKNQIKERMLFEQLVQSQKLDSLGSLAGGVAHDINNVLASIMAVAGTLESSPNVKILERAANRGKDLVKRLTNFARLSANETVPINIEDILLQDIELLKRTTLNKITIVSNIAKLPMTLGNPSDISNVLMNLCVNAIDAMPEGGSLTIQAEVIKKDIKIIVSDTGTGIPSKLLHRVQEPFFTTKEVGKGTGLGLSIVHSIIKAHKGTVTIESVEGVGTSISFTVPIVSYQGADPLDDLVKVFTSTKLIRILMIDDDDLVRESTSKLLATKNFEVTTAASGKEGLAYLANDSFDLVILDKNMPEMNGLETLALIRAKSKDLPVIIASGYLEETSTPSDGKTFFLQKPYTLQTLDYLLNRIFS